MNRTESEQVAELTADDIVKLRAKKMGYGCPIFLVPCLLFTGWFLMFLTNPSFQNGRSLILTAVFLLLASGVLWLAFSIVKNTNGRIDQDILGMRKKVTVAPIQSKRVESTDIKRGINKGGVALKYFMTVRGTEYDMTEQRYLLIKVGEFVELHEAPNSKTIIRQVWLKEDGELEVI